MYKLDETSISLTLKKIKTVIYENGLVIGGGGWWGDNSMGLYPYQMGMPNQPSSAHPERPSKNEGPITPQCPILLSSLHLMSWFSSLFVFENMDGVI